MSNQNYWISERNCVWNALYHSYHHQDKKNNKMRAGCLYYNGECIWGNDKNFNLYEDIDVKKFEYGCGHCWTECKDGTIVDWVINDKLGISSQTQVKWDKEELKRQGFVYMPYKNETGIIKTKRQLCCSCKNVKKGLTQECAIDWAKKFWCHRNL